MKTLFDVPENPVDKYSKYSCNIGIPVYTPKGEKPNILELCDGTKVGKLIKHIKDSGVSEEEKEFLIKSAYRHYVFRYDKIAEYYAHASKEMQELMEESALVIIDFNDAILNGYVKAGMHVNAIIDRYNEAKNNDEN